jgi:hypothetical protein
VHKAAHVPKLAPEAAVVWPTTAPKAVRKPARHERTVMETMLLTTVPALLAVAVLRPGSHTYRRNH